MFDYFVYVDPNGPTRWNTVRYEIQCLREYCWQRSAHVRWRYEDPGHFNLAMTPDDRLIILDWPSEGAGARRARLLLDSLRQGQTSRPILIVDRGNSGWIRESGLNLADLPVFPEDEVCIIPEGELCDAEHVSNALARLHVSLQSPSLHLEPTINSLEMTSLMNWIGQEKLALTAAKFFPEAEKARVWPIGGGWSGTRLCEVFVEDSGPDSYFLKFFSRQSEQSREIVQHLKAKTWLGHHLVDVHAVPNMEPDDGAQTQAFPPSLPSLWPVCYVSAANHDHPRETLRKVYQTHDSSFVEAALSELLLILDPGASEDLVRHRRSPWAFRPGEEGFPFSDSKKAAVTTVLDDLSRYGPAMCGHGWERCLQHIDSLLYRSPPRWLERPCSVAVGNTHGDPNPRNCLVNRTDPRDLQLIDAGEYSDDGRLVSDLAIIERDIKLVLLATEPKAPGFADLDVAELKTWCEAERKCLANGVGFNLSGFNRGTWWSTNRSTARAFRLVALVRQAARKICGEQDKEGVHYFASLLFWTLDALRYDAIRPTKKLLALYSAAEILRSFG